VITDPPTDPIDPQVVTVLIRPAPHFVACLLKVDFTKVNVYIYRTLATCCCCRRRYVTVWGKGLGVELNMPVSRNNSGHWQIVYVCAFGITQRNMLLADR